MAHSGKTTNSTGWNAIFSWIKYALTGKRDETKAVSQSSVSASSLVELNARLESLEKIISSGRFGDMKAESLDAPNVMIGGVPVSPGDHTHQVKINGSTKTIAKTGGTPVDLGTYLTQHQDISGKADVSTVVDSASYNSSNHTIVFKHGSTQLFTLDAAAFVKDGMVDSVAISNGNLVITFNTDAGKQPISIPLTDIFNPNNYYTKTDTDALLAAKQPERLVVTPTESGGVYSNDFATISAAVTAGKDVWLRISGPYDNSSYFHYVPLSEAVFKNGAYTKFIFARPRSYETEAEGIIDTWTCTSSSPYWVYASKNVYYAATAGVASSAGTANNYTSEGGIANALAGKSDTGHTHDDRYYTKSEIDTTNAAVVNLIDQVDQRHVPIEPKAIGNSGVLNAGYIGAVVTCVWNNYSISSPQVSTVVNYCVTAQYQGLNGMTYLLVNNTINEITLSGMAGSPSSISWMPGQIIMVLRWANDYYYIGK